MLHIQCPLNFADMSISSRRRPGNRLSTCQEVAHKVTPRAFHKLRIDETRIILLFVSYPSSTSNGIYETDHSHFMPPLDQEDSTNDRPIHFVSQFHGSSKRRDSFSNQDGSSRQG